MSSDWRLRAACREVDPELFFPVGAGGPALAQAERAKAICRRCPVVEQCLAFALAARVADGIWAGLDETELRERLRSLPPPPRPKPRDGQCHQCGHPLTGTRRRLCDDCRRRPVAECGTPSGYRHHKATGTPTCQPCRDAAAAYNRARRARKRVAA